MYDVIVSARMILGGPGCRLQTCSCLAAEWFNSTFRAKEPVVVSVCEVILQQRHNNSNNEMLLLDGVFYIYYYCLIHGCRQKVNVNRFCDRIRNTYCVEKCTYTD